MSNNSMFVSTPVFANEYDYFLYAASQRCAARSSSLG